MLAAMTGARLFVSRTTQHLACLWISKMKSLAGRARHALINLSVILGLVVLRPALYLKAGGRAAVGKCSHSEAPLHQGSCAQGGPTAASMTGARQAALTYVK